MSPLSNPMCYPLQSCTSDDDIFRGRATRSPISDRLKNGDRKWPHYIPVWNAPAEYQRREGGGNKRINAGETTPRGNSGTLRSCRGDSVGYNDRKEAARAYSLGNKDVNESRKLERRRHRGGGWKINRASWTVDRSREIWRGEGY